MAVYPRGLGFQGYMRAFVIYRLRSLRWQLRIQPQLAWEHGIEKLFYNLEVCVASLGFMVSVYTVVGK